MRSSMRMGDAYVLAVAPRRGDKTSTPSHPPSGGSGAPVGILVGLVLLSVAALVVGRSLWRRSLNLQPEPPHIDPQQAWDAAAPAIEALGFRRSRADKFVRDEGTHESASVHIDDDKRLRASLDGQAPGGVIETFLKQEVELLPGRTQHSAFGQWAYESVASAIVRLPRDARVRIEVPHLPGERYELEVHASLFAPEHPAAAAQIVVMFAEAARKPASADALSAALPRVARLMMEAARELTALGLHERTLLAYGRSGPTTCSVYADDDDDTLTGRYRSSLPDAAIERYIGVSETIHPGGHAGHELCQWVMAQLGAELGALPHKASIDMRVAKLPGADTEVRVTLPFTAAAEAVAVARLLLAFERIASRPLPPGSPPAPFSPLAQRWIAAGPLLVAAGLHKAGPDSYRRDMGNGAFYIEVDVEDETLEGRVSRHASERKIALFADTEVELTPGDAGRTPLGKWTAGVVGQALGALPRGSTLKVEAPKRAGDTYTLRVEAPFKDPVHARVVVDLLAMLDAAAQGPPVAS
jgi:hypothetical protein